MPASTVLCKIRITWWRISTTCSPSARFSPSSPAGTIGSRKCPATCIRKRSASCISGLRSLESISSSSRSISSGSPACRGVLPTIPMLSRAVTWCRRWVPTFQGWARWCFSSARPIPQGRIAPGEALAFGIVLAAFAVGVLGLLVSWLAAMLLAFTIFFYVAVYTAWLKRWTPQNIVIGGAAGAFPPVIGWVAATGSISLEPCLLFLIIFCWTPPHFWSLSLVRADDYARARVPMLPVVAGLEETRRQILLYSIGLVPIGAAPWLFGYAHTIYGVTALLAGALMVTFAWRVRCEREGERAERAAYDLFAFSILYLFVLFAVLLVEGSVIGRAM